MRGKPPVQHPVPVQSLTGTAATYRASTYNEVAKNISLNESVDQLPCTAKSHDLPNRRCNDFHISKSRNL